MILYFCRPRPRKTPTLPPPAFALSLAPTKAPRYSYGEGFEYSGGEDAVTSEDENCLYDRARLRHLGNADFNDYRRDECGEDEFFPWHTRGAPDKN